VVFDDEIAKGVLGVCVSEGGLFGVRSGDAGVAGELAECSPGAVSHDSDGAGDAELKSGDVGGNRVVRGGASGCAGGLTSSGEGVVFRHANSVFVSKAN
jgi:hypothetical protein